MPLVLSLRGGEGRGEDGEKEKRKKIAFIRHQCLLQPPLHPPLFHSVPSFSLLRFHPIFSCLSSFSFPVPPSPSSFCRSESVVFNAPFGVIQLSLLFHFFLCQPLFFLPPFLSYQKNSSHRETHFHTSFLCVHICPGAFFFVSVRLAFSTVNLSSLSVDCMLSYVFIRDAFGVWVFVCVCVRPVGEWSINHTDGAVCCVVGSPCSGRFQGPGTAPRPGFPRDAHTHIHSQRYLDGHTQCVHSEVGAEHRYSCVHVGFVDNLLEYRSSWASFEKMQI